MAAVIGLTDLKIEQVLRKNDLKNIAIANYNTPSQFVVAGPAEDLNKAKSIFEDAGALLYIPLNVSGAFHTLHMKPVQDEFEQYIERFDFSDIGVPVIANVTGEPYRKNEIKKNLVSQIAKPVLWISSIRYLMGIKNMRFEEIGPGNVLTNLVKKILSETQKKDADERCWN